MQMGDNYNKLLVTYSINEIESHIKTQRPEYALITFIKRNLYFSISGKVYENDTDHFSDLLISYNLRL